MTEDETYSHVAWNPHRLAPGTHLPDAVLGKLLRLSSETATYVARNAVLTTEAVTYIEEECHSDILDEALSNPSLPAEELYKRSRPEHLTANQQILANPSLPVEQQHEVFERIDGFQYQILAQNPGLDPDLQLRLWNDTTSEDGALWFGIMLSSCADLHPRIVEDVLTQSSLLRFQVHLAFNRHVSGNVLRKLSTTEESTFLNANLPVDLLPTHTNGVPDTLLRRAAMHPGLSDDMRRQLAQGKTRDLRSTAVEYAQSTSLQYEFYQNPDFHENLAANRFLDTDLAALLLERYQVSDPLMAKWMWRSRCYVRSDQSPVRIAYHLSPYLLEVAAVTSGLDATEVYTLAETWTGSIGELLEATWLTRR